MRSQLPAPGNTLVGALQFLDKVQKGQRSDVRPGNSINLG